MEKELADYVTQLEKQIATLRQGQLEAILTAKPDFWIDQFLKGYRALSTIREQT